MYAEKKAMGRRWVRVLVIVSVVSFIIPAILTVADTDGHGKPLEEVLAGIRADLGLESGGRIDPEEVSDSDLEEVGEAVMSIMHPDPRQHEMMDQMMGGEGSPSLAAMHRMMGYNYLAGGRGYSPSGRGWGGMMGPGMMGGGMMGPGMMGGGMMNPGMGWGMMGPGMMGGRWGGPWMRFPLGGVIMWIVVIALIVAVVYLIVRVRKTAGSGRIVSGSPRSDTPLHIAQKRYAQGEISREEYETIRKSL
jgi:uncharacterized membrane protein